MTGTPSPARLADARLPDEFLAAVAELPDIGGDDVVQLALNFRADMEAGYGLPTSDPWIVAGMVAACRHIEYLARRHVESGSGLFTEREAFAAGAFAMQCASIWVEVLRQLDALPQPGDN